MQASATPRLLMAVVNPAADRVGGSTLRFVRCICAVLVAAVLAVLSGCSTVGPVMIRSGRPAYNDAILTTSDEQLLQNIVRLRFLDSLGFLTVSSVTANVSLGVNASVNVGIGSSQSYQGNLIPFAAAVTTEQNPTISYTPVAGDRLIRQLLAETPVDLIILIMNATQDYTAAWYALARRVNDIRNPDFIEPPNVVVDARFGDIVELASELQRQGILHWTHHGAVESGAALVLHGYALTRSPEAARLLDYLGVTTPMRDGDDIVVPIQFSTASARPGMMVIETRSLFNLMQLAAASIELPADVAAVARQYPERGPGGRNIRIVSGASRPSQARVAVEYRGRWYYIEDNDQRSKQWFLMLQMIASAEVIETPATTGPILTLPAGRR